MDENEITKAKKKYFKNSYFWSTSIVIILCQSGTDSFDISENMPFGA